MHRICTICLWPMKENRSSRGEPVQNPAANAAAPESRTTREYVNAVAQSDAFERLEATTALALSKSGAVRAFATRMLSEHEDSSQKLAKAVSLAGLEPSQPGISGDQSAFLAALQSARGDAFDCLYAASSRRHMCASIPACISTTGTISAAVAFRCGALPCIE